MVTLFKGHNFSFQNEAQHFCGLLEAVGIWILRGHENGLHQIVRSKIRFFSLTQKKLEKSAGNPRDIRFIFYVHLSLAGGAGWQAGLAWLAGLGFLGSTECKYYFCSGLYLNYCCRRAMTILGK